MPKNWTTIKKQTSNNRTCCSHTQQQQHQFLQLHTKQHIITQLLTPQKTKKVYTTIVVKKMQILEPLTYFHTRGMTKMEFLLPRENHVCFVQVLLWTLKSPPTTSFFLVSSFKKLKGSYHFIYGMSCHVILEYIYALVKPNNNNIGCNEL